MKKSIFIFLFILISHSIFSQNFEPPVFLIEANAGYAIGINLDSAMPIDLKIISPINKFGFTFEIGTLLFTEKTSFHVFLGPMMFLLNNEKWRIPIAVGFDMYYIDSFYYGIGGFISLHRRLTNYLYLGLNLGITYAFNNVYKEITGYDIRKEVVDDGTGNAIFVEKSTPIFKDKDHWGNYIYFRPSLLIGIQF